MAIIKQHEDSAQAIRQMKAIDLAERMNHALNYMKDIELSGGAVSV
jgi:hypothetical protein